MPLLPFLNVDTWRHYTTVYVITAASMGRGDMDEDREEMERRQVQASPCTLLVGPEGCQRPEHGQKGWPYACLCTWDDSLRGLQQAAAGSQGEVGLCGRALFSGG